MDNKIKGILSGCLASSSFGLMPAMTIPLNEAGLSMPAILAYRTIIATIILFVILCFRKGVSFRISGKEFLLVFFLGSLYFYTASLLFYGYQHVGGGVATVLHFQYPIFVTLIMFFIYKQKISPFTIGAILFSIIGVILISWAKIKLTGLGGFIPMLLVITTGLTYGIYMVLVNNISLLRKMDYVKLTFYTVLFGELWFTFYAAMEGEMIFPREAKAWGYLFLLAFLPTVISNLALVYAVKSIGSTLAAGLGALEPLTAVVVGIWAFSEILTTESTLGIIIIIIAVTLIIMAPYLDKNVEERLKRFEKNKIRQRNRRIANRNKD